MFTAFKFFISRLYSALKMSKQQSLWSFLSPKSGQGANKAPPSPRNNVASPSTATTPKSAKPQRSPLRKVNSPATRKREEEEDENKEQTPKRRKIIISSDEEEGGMSDGGDHDYKPEEDGEEAGGEDEEEEDGDGEEEEEFTPEKKRKKVQKKVVKNEIEESADEEMGEGSDDGEGTGEESAKFIPEMADSFIGSFTLKDEDVTEKVKAQIEAGVIARTFKQKNDEEEEEEEEENEEEKPTKRLKTPKTEEGEEDEEISVEEYVHETLKFLKPDYIRDAEKRRPDDPLYDPSTLYVPDDFIKTQTPGHQQWWTLKGANFDTVLFFKVGKFYEMYHMDATVAVNCLNLAFMKGKYAHCGFPESAYGRFADQLVERGHKVARVEQTETPDQLAERAANEKGKKSKVVRRELCRVTTVGTRTYDAMEMTTQPGANGKAEEEGEGVSMEALAPTAYLLAIKERSDVSTVAIGVAFIDTSLGRFHVGSFEDDHYYSHLRTLIARYPPAQVLIERASLSSATRSVLDSMLPIHVPVDSLAPKKEFVPAEKTISMLIDQKMLGADASMWPHALKTMLQEESGIPTPNKNHGEAWSALGALISYLARCQIEVDMVTMRQFERFDPTATTSASTVNDSSSLPPSTRECWKGRRMVVDGVGLEQLSLLPLDYATEQTTGSLYSILNKCKTPFGSRLLRSWVCAPSCDPDTIEERQKALLWLQTAAGKSCADKVEDMLESLPDLERLLQKIHSIGLVHRARDHPDARAIMFEANTYAKRRIRDLVNALDGFRKVQEIGEWCDACRRENEEESGSKDDNPLLSCAAFDVQENLNHFANAFDAEKAVQDGKIIPKEGANEEYDAANERVREVKRQLEEYREHWETKMKCKVSLVNSVKDRNLLEFPEKKGPEVPMGEFKDKGKRKGFLRYTSPTLSRLNAELMEAETDVQCLLKDATRSMFAEFDDKKSSWRRALSSVATLDVLLSLSKYADATGVAMCAPLFVYDAQQPLLQIKEGYHPSIVITGLASLSDEGVESSSTTFIPNDVRLGGDGACALLLTGPNMGGKSTLMRQVAVLTVLAHMGSLVPARSMVLSPVDRIFTRVGASDRLVSGQSTFFVEMNESAIALRDATRSSLAIFDELGRGTGTRDGQSLAWAILQDMTKRVGARCVFSTHYHGLCERLADDSTVLQMHMGCVVENEDESAVPTEESVTFLYKLADGVCPRSFGFNAARLAGISDRVIKESWRAARSAFGDKKALKALRDAAADPFKPVEELRRMMEECF